jgi:hypothetical protein
VEFSRRYIPLENQRIVDFRLCAVTPLLCREKKAVLGRA